LGTIFKLDTETGDAVVLHSFSAGREDGDSPQGGIIIGTDGVLYGTTVLGGSSNAGVVFRMERDGSQFRVLHHFKDSEQDGANPVCTLVAGDGGVLFGTTYAGGSHNNGTVFRVNRDGRGYKILHHFEGREVDGKNPCSRLTLGRGGWLYGTTVFGGISASGIVYKLSGDGTGFQVLHFFDSGESDAANPYAGLLVSPSGVLFGAATAGGQLGFGAIFCLNEDGSEYQLLHDYRGGEGAFPHGSLAFGVDGSLYGTTMAGGSVDGTAFKMRPNGSGYTVLHRFGGDDKDGASPYTGLTLGTNGIFYATTKDGGNQDRGTVFSIRSF
jgi:uncharacterized repeat protein (TIGR03803 family)